MTPQDGDAEIVPFSFMNDHLQRDQIRCWLTYTNEKTHDIIRKNFESDEMASNYYDSFEDFQETLIDWDWDSVAVHPHVRLNSLSLTMSDTELVPRVMLFPLLNFKCE